MPSTVPVMRGRMGSIDYYVTTMKAGEAIEKIRLAEELPGWKEMTIEERVQRELAWGRVEKDIAKYIATDPERFYGALLVAIYNSEGISFEPLDKFKGLPELYVKAASSFGFLNFQGGEILFALDGQHRLKGTESAITGKGEKGKKLDNFEANLKVATDDIAVILIEYDPPMRARKIFNKTNKYAKSTSKGDNIITSEDDAYAIISRRLMCSDGDDEAIIPESLVNWTSNTLTARSTQFTTINVLYESGEKLLEKLDKQFRPDDDKLDELCDQLRSIWRTVFDKFDLFNQAVNGSPKNLPKLREQYLCMKPAGQLALLTAVQECMRREMDIESIAARLNKVPWQSTNDLWQGVMMQGQRIQAGKQSVGLAGRLIAYLIGAPFTDDEAEMLLRDYRRAVEKDPEKPVKAKTLPDRLVSNGDAA